MPMEAWESITRAWTLPRAPISQFPPLMMVAAVRVLIPTMAGRASILATEDRAQTKVMAARVSTLMVVRVQILGRVGKAQIKVMAARASILIVVARVPTQGAVGKASTRIAAGRVLILETIRKRNW